jgi:hypothetical protein
MPRRGPLQPLPGSHFDSRPLRPLRASRGGFRSTMEGGTRTHTAFPAAERAKSRIVRHTGPVRTTSRAVRRRPQTSIEIWQDSALKLAREGCVSSGNASPQQAPRGGKALAELTSSMIERWKKAAEVGSAGGLLCRRRNRPAARFAGSLNAFNYGAWCTATRREMKRSKPCPRNRHG